MASIERTSDTKDTIVRGMGSLATVQPVVGTGPQGPPGPGASNSDIAGYVGASGATKSALDLAYTKARRRDIQTLGVTGNRTDETAAIQAAHDAAYAGGYGLAYTPTTSTGAAANYTCGSGQTVTTAGVPALQIRLDAIDFEVVKGATVTKNWNITGGGGNGQALFCNRDMATNIQGGFLSVEGRVRTATTSMDGNLFSLRADHLRIPHFMCDQFGKGRVFALLGDYIWLGGDFYINGGPNVAGSAGVRLYGGKGFRTSPGGYIECGDDTLVQFVPAGPSSDPFYGVDIVDCINFGWTGISHVGKGMIADLQDATSGNGVPTMVQSILRSGWIGCTAMGVNAQAKAQNQNGIGNVDVFAVDCTLDASNSANVGPEILAIRQPPTGALGSIRFTIIRTQILNPLKSAAGTSGDATLRLYDVDLPKPITTSSPAINIPAGRLVAKGGTWDGGGVASQNVVAIGAAAHDCIIEPTEITGIGTSGKGINVASGAADTRIGGRIAYTKASGATTTKGVNIASGATGTVLLPGGDYRNVDTAWTDAGTSSTVPAATATGFDPVAFAGVTIGSVQYAARTTDATAVNNSTTLVTSAVLVATLVANATYVFEGVIWCDTGDASSDLKLGWSVPAGATGFWTADGPQAATAAGTNTGVVRTQTSIGSTATMGGVAGVAMATIPMGTVTTGATAGTFAMQYAQATAVAFDLVIKSGSFIKVTRVA